MVFCIPEDDIPHSHRRENFKSYIVLTGWALYCRRNVSPERYELGFFISEYHILHSHCCENLKSYIALTGWALYRRRNVFSVRYKLGFYILDDAIFIVTAVNTTNLNDPAVFGCSVSAR
jgi:hypothetical protein